MERFTQTEFDDASDAGRTSFRGCDLSGLVIRRHFGLDITGARLDGAILEAPVAAADRDTSIRDATILRFIVDSRKARVDGLDLAGSRIGELRVSDGHLTNPRLTGTTIAEFTVDGQGMLVRPQMAGARINAMNILGSGSLIGPIDDAAGISHLTMGNDAHGGWHGTVHAGHLRMAPWRHIPGTRFVQDLDDPPPFHGAVRTGRGWAFIKTIPTETLRHTRLPHNAFTGTLINVAFPDDAPAAHLTLDMVRATRVQAPGLQAPDCTFINTHFHDTDFSGAHLDNAVMRNVNFRYSTSLRRASLRGAVFADCSFERCDLTGTDFTDATFTNCVFPDVDVTRTDFTGARFHRTPLPG